MSVDIFLSRLDQVRKTGADSWIACCPAHADKRPSMSIREMGDGRVLAHCFAGCGFDEILNAAGADVNDFFPEKPLFHRAKSVRRGYPASDVLEMLSFEATVVQLAAADMSKGIAISEPDKQRLGLAARRIRDAVELANG